MRTQHRFRWNGIGELDDHQLAWVCQSHVRQSPNGAVSQPPFYLARPVILDLGQDGGGGQNSAFRLDLRNAGQAEPLTFLTPEQRDGKRSIPGGNRPR